MKPNCALSCGVCSSPGPAPAPVPAPGPVAAPPGDCVDKDAKCGLWKTIGGCAGNPDYMKPNCALSCGVCSSPGPAPAPGPVAAPPGDCVDKDAKCGMWKTIGGC